MRRLEDIFPYSSLRKGQRELIDFIFTIFAEGKIGLAHAPTGIGKTIAILTANALIDDNKQLIILTRTKSQAKIYYKELLALRKRGVKVPFLFLRSKQELCPFTKKGRLAKVPYGVFLRICEQLKSKGKCIYFANSIRSGEFSEYLIKVGSRLATHGVTSKRLIKVTLRKKLCPYELARFLIPYSKIIVGSYPYLINTRIRDIFLRSSNLDLSNVRIVIDEAHNLPDAIVEQNTVRLPLAILNRAINNLEKVMETKKMDLSYIDLANEVKTFLKDFRSDLLQLLTQRAYRREFEIDLATLISSYDFRIINKILDLSQVLADSETQLATDILVIHRFLEHFIEEFNDNEYISYVTVTENKDFIIHSKPLDPAPIIENLFRESYSTLLVSGTLYPLEYYKMILGLTRSTLYEKTEAIVVESSFSPDAIMVLVDLAVTSRYDERTESMFNLYAQRILSIVEVIPKDSPILIVFPSYSFMNRILERLKIFPRKFLIEDKKTKLRQVIKFLLNSPGGVIFSVAGGKLAEGIDYTYRGKTLIQIVIIAGLPFPEYNLYTSQVMKYYSEKLHSKDYAQFITIIAPMIRRLLQISGRIIRHEKDRGLVIVMDRRFPRYAQYLPKIPWQVYIPYRTDAQLRVTINRALSHIQHS